MVSNKVDIIHVSDAKGHIAGLKETEHLPLGIGEIDFRGLFEEILRSKFHRPIVLETQETEINNAVNMAAGRKYLEMILADIHKRLR